MSPVSSSGSEKDLGSEKDMFVGMYDGHHQDDESVHLVVGDKVNGLGDGPPQQK